MSKRILKRAILHALRFSGAERLRDFVWERQSLHPACILCFHRVTDAIPEDGITVTPSRFTAIIEAIARDYAPVSLRSIVENIEQGRPWPRRAVAITFDDGYLDNYQVAAPILKKFAVPCTFFVAAHLVGSQTVSPWDRHLAGKVPWMQWSHLRELRDQGFDIGSHTLTHCDLGKAEGAEARREIEESGVVLERELGTRPDLFAFPFGSPANITESNLEIVRGSYRCCCSAFGGILRGRVDPYRLRRVPVNRWFETLSDLHFELRLLAPWRWGRPRSEDPALPEFRAHG